MTNKEALEVFRKRDVCYDNGCPDDMYTCVDCPNHYTEKEYSDAMDLAKKALEKQIPAKPAKQTDEWNENLYYLRCPSCNAVVASGNSRVGYCDRVNKGYTICRKCGQAIDWEDE